jgi:UDP-N-acetylmuramoyl-L-alanyl-D-glutamate--2,6-diaminopimelate ligase
MRLSHLIQAVPTIRGQVGCDIDVFGIATNSQQVEPGDVFVAVPGVYVDGHDFISDAVNNGAVAVVGEQQPQALGDVPWGAFTYVSVANARRALGWMCAAWHDFPSRKMTVIGVTGTDGKTTTVNLLYSILRAAGHAVGMISTVNARIGEEEIDTGFHVTTPDAPDVQRYLAQMVEAGAIHAVLEVTSHGLAQHRVAGVDFDVAAVTNITHEHLDAHGSMEAYQQAKASLFEGLAHSTRKSGVPKVAILNRDDDSFRYLSPIPADRQIAYGVGGEVSVRDVRFASDATRFTLALPTGDVAVETALVGNFNVSNILAAASVGVALDVPPDAIARGIVAMEGIPGRMERVDAGQDFLAIVDFAHTPNALQNALETARTLVGEGGRLAVVFGCAGLRDREKRPIMGRIAGELADLVIVTAEDPRTEGLEEIMAESAAAAVKEGKREGVDLWRIADRGEAILKACQMAQAGDVVISCGKGHEQSMCFGETEYPWDDREAMRQALRGEPLSSLPTAGMDSG